MEEQKEEVTKDLIWNTDDDNSGRASEGSTQLNVVKHIPESSLAAALITGNQSQIQASHADPFAEFFTVARYSSLFCKAALDCMSLTKEENKR